MNNRILLEAALALLAGFAFSAAIVGLAIALAAVLS